MSLLDRSVDTRRMNRATKPYLSTVLTLAVGLLFAARPAAAQYAFTGFGPGQWGASDATLGITGLTIEDFEDVNLAPGLQIQATNSTLGAYGPTGTLPQTFNPNTQDGFGSAFVGGNWDGSNVLINTGTNRPGDYLTASVWGNIIFTFSGAGATRVGFSFEQSEANTNVIVNGQNLGVLQTLAGLGLSSGRIGYIRIDATGSAAPITSLQLTNNASGDGWAIDHFAFNSATASAAPEPTSLALLLLTGSAAGTAAAMRRRRCCWR